MKKVINILLDYSGSMDEGKLSIAKRLLIDEIIPNLDPYSKVGFSVFNTLTGTEPNIQHLQDLKLAYTCKEKLASIIQGIDNPSGQTPIAAAIKTSVKEFKKHMSSQKKIILVTDGAENCGGDYIQEAKKARREGIECKIHIIGLGLSNDAKRKAEEIAQLTKGSFSNISSDKLKDSSKFALYDFKDSISNLIKDIANSGVTLVAPSNDSWNKYSTKNLETKEHKPEDYNSASSNSDMVKEYDNSEKNIIQKRNRIGQILGGILLHKKNRDLHYSSKNRLALDTKKNSRFSNIYGKVSELEKELRNLKDEIEKIESETPESTVDEEWNIRIGEASEKFVNEILEKRFGERLIWHNKDGESGMDHDFKIVDADDPSETEYFVECKGTATNEKRFFLTKSEWNLFINHTKNYQVFFVYNVLSNPQFIKIDNLLDWVLNGRIVPYSTKNIHLQADRIIFTIKEFD